MLAGIARGRHAARQTSQPRARLHDGGCSGRLSLSRRDTLHFTLTCAETTPLALTLEAQAGESALLPSSCLACRSCLPAAAIAETLAGRARCRGGGWGGKGEGRGRGRGVEVEACGAWRRWPVVSRARDCRHLIHGGIHARAMLRLRLWVRSRARGVALVFVHDGQPDTCDPNASARCTQLQYGGYLLVSGSSFPRLEPGVAGSAGGVWVWVWVWAWDGGHLQSQQSSYSSGLLHSPVHVGPSSKHESQRSSLA